MVTQSVDRKDNFREDKAVTTGSATLNDYKKSGYDRGHMAPAADFRWSFDAMNDTFYLSNMCPQTHAFNAGIWSDLLFLSISIKSFSITQPQPLRP